MPQIHRSSLYSDNERRDAFDQKLRRPGPYLDGDFLDKQEKSGKLSDNFKMLIAGGVILFIVFVAAAVLLGVLLSGSGQCLKSS